MAEQYAAAAQVLSQAQEAAERLGSSSLGRITMDLGVARIWLGDVASAQILLHAALKDPSLSHRRQAAATYNLAVVEEVSGQLPDAIALYWAAQALFGQVQGQERQELQCSMAIAWCHLLLQQPELARQAIERSEAWSVVMPNVPVHDLLLPHWAFYYRQTGDLTTSMEYCEQAIAAPGLLDRDYHNTLGEAYWIAGQNALDLGRLPESRMFAQNAIQHGMKLQWSSLVNRANQLRRSAERFMR